MGKLGGFSVAELRAIGPLIEQREGAYVPWARPSTSQTPGEELMLNRTFRTATPLAKCYAAVGAVATLAMLILLWNELTRRPNAVLVFELVLVVGLGLMLSWIAGFRLPWSEVAIATREGVRFRGPFSRIEFDPARDVAIVEWRNDRARLIDKGVVVRLVRPGGGSRSVWMDLGTFHEFAALWAGGRTAASEVRPHGHG